MAKWESPQVANKFTVLRNDLEYCVTRESAKLWLNQEWLKSELVLF